MNRLIWKWVAVLISFLIPLLSFQVQWAGSPPALWVTGPWAAPQSPPPPQPCGPASTAPSWTSLAQSTVKCAACPAVKKPRPPPYFCALPCPALPCPALILSRPALLLTRQWHHCNWTSCEIWMPFLFSFASLWNLCPARLTGCCDAWKGCTRLHRIQWVNKIKPDCVSFVSLLTAALVSGGVR